jgi:hypothetical protein
VCWTWRWNDWLFWKKKFTTDNSFDIKKRSILNFDTCLVSETLDFSIAGSVVLFLGHSGGLKSLLSTKGWVFTTVLLKGLSIFLFSFLVLCCNEVWGAHGGKDIDVSGCNTKWFCRQTGRHNHFLSHMTLHLRRPSSLCSNFWSN